MNGQTLQANYILTHFQTSPVLQLWIFVIYALIIFVIFLCVWIICALMYFVLRTVIAYMLSLKEESVFLEVTPPAKSDRSVSTQQQVFSILHRVGSEKSMLEKIINRKTLFSFEIVSTRKEGIRYIVRTTEKYVRVLEQTFVSSLPGVRVRRVADYVSGNNAEVASFALNRHFAYPLAKQEAISDHDPVAYITGSLTGLPERGIVAVQIVAEPISPHEVTTIAKKILDNEDILEYLDADYPSIIWFPFRIVFRMIGMFFDALIWIIQELFQTSKERESKQLQYLNQLTANRLRPARTLSIFEQNTVRTIQEKIQQPLFAVSMRVYVDGETIKEAKKRIQEVSASFSPFGVPEYQFIERLSSIPFLSTKLRSFLFRKRQLSFLANRSTSLLSVSELADLYHFPMDQLTKTENMVKVYSTNLPAPLSLKKNIKQFDVIFARNTYGKTPTPIGLTTEERRRHIYMIGATGMGKSTMLLSLIHSDLMRGKGLAVVDPHGELAEDILKIIPESRKNDVVYVNPDDLSYPIGINLMELTPNLSEEDTLREKEFVAESIVSLFRKLFVHDMKGNPHHVEYVLRNTIHTAFSVEHPTLFTIYDILNNPVFRKEIVGKLTDKNLVNFWKNEFNKAGNYQKIKMTSPVTARIGRFLFSPSASRIMGQERSTINFDEILNGKILLCNLAKGKLGEDTSQVLGIMILNKLQLAALKRARVPVEERHDFYLYVDEFQHFATRSFVEMLSEARKYHLNMILAQQSTSQEEDRDLVHIILANVGTVACFRTANPEDEKLFLPQFDPYIKKGEIASLPAFRFYMKVSALSPEEPFSGETIVQPITNNRKKVEEIIALSRKNYADSYRDSSRVERNERKVKIDTKRKQQVGIDAPEKGG